MKYIKLTKGLEAVVDDEDYERVNKLKWFASDSGKGNYYAARGITQSETGPKKMYMHRFIIGLTDLSMQVDHIDGNRLNNQRSNLRVVTSIQNIMNAKSHGKCPYKGVSYYRAGRKHYLAKIMAEGKRHILGYYKTPEEAARVYNEAAIKFFGEYAKLNDIKNH